MQAHCPSVPTRVRPEREGLGLFHGAAKKPPVVHPLVYVPDMYLTLNIPPGPTMASKDNCRAVWEGGCLERHG